MTRTTIDIDGPVLREVRALQQTEGPSLGRVVSQLLAEALAQHRAPVPPARLAWTCRPMGALVDLEDKEALGNVEALLQLPRVQVLSEAEGFLAVYREVTGSVVVRGNLVQDAHLAALLRQYGVRTLYTSDADFRKFRFLD